MNQNDLVRVREYVVQEKETAAPMVAWELGISQYRAATALDHLEKMGVLAIIFPGIKGSLGGPPVYGYQELPKGPTERPRRPPPEQEVVRRFAGSRGEVVPLTGKAKGYSRSPGRDKARLKSGHRLRTSTKR